MIFFSISERLYSITEKQRYDGWFNNLAHPDWGSVGKRFVFLLRLEINSTEKPITASTFTIITRMTLFSAKYVSGQGYLCAEMMLAFCKPLKLKFNSPSELSSYHFI